MTLCQKTEDMLRAPESRDVELIYTWENDPERLLHGRTGLPYSRETIEDYVSNYNETALGSGNLRFIVVKNESKEACGIIDLYDIDFSSRKAFTSVYIDIDNRNQGLGKQAIADIISFGRDHLGLNQIVAVISTENQVSVKLFESAGFKKAAVLPQWVRSTEGRLIPAYLYTYFL